MSTRFLKWFAAFLVLLEFATYASNDMILPAMPIIISEFNGVIQHISLSMGLYILGCACTQLFIAPLAGYYGQRNMLIFGAVYFVITTLLILFSDNIVAFLSFRFLAGASMSFASLGYAIIHNSFNDEDSTKITSLMQNFAIISPIIGPMLGVFIIKYFTWYYIFVFAAFLGVISLFGIRFSLPKPSKPQKKISLKKTFQMYGLLLRNKMYIIGTLAMLVIGLPYLIWIATSTAVIKDTLKLSDADYIVLQLISLGGVLFSTFVIHMLAGKIRFYKFIAFGLCISILGLSVGFFAVENIYLVSIGMLIYSFGLGIFSTLAMRIIGTIPFENTNIIFTFQMFIHLTGVFIGIILAEILFTFNAHKVNSFAISNGISIILIVYLGGLFTYKNRDRIWQLN